MVVITPNAGTELTEALEFETLMNTNTGMKTTESEVIILSPGIYEIIGEITLTSTAAGDFGISIKAGNAVIGMISTASAEADGETLTLPVYGITKVDLTKMDTNVEITFVPNGEPTVIDGEISIKKIS